MGYSSGDDATGAGDYVSAHSDSGNWIFSPQAKAAGLPNGLVGNAACGEG